MILQSGMQQQFRQIQPEFNKRYPFLKIEFTHPTDETRISYTPERREQAEAIRVLENDIGLSDDMTVAELGHAFQDWSGRPVTLFRQDGSHWTATIPKGTWTLKQHNNHGRRVSTQFQ